MTKSKRTIKAVTAGLMAAMLTFSSAVQATETFDVPSETTLGIEDYAENIKSVYKANYPEQADIIDDIVDTLVFSDEFAGIFADEGTTAFQIVEDSLRDVLSPEPLPQIQTDDYYASKYFFQPIQQINDYYCGPASTLMALMGSGAKDYTYTSNTSTTDGWQTKLANELGTTQSSGTNISMITKVLNNNVPSVNGYKFKTKAFTVYSYQRALDFIEISLVEDCVPVIRVPDTTLLHYYGDKKFSHYMVVESVDFNAECVTLYDPHYDNKYFGRHIISYEEFENLAKNSKDFWVSVYTKVKSDDSYIYE